MRIALAVFGLLIGGSWGGAPQDTSEIIRGRLLYREYCASCHGASGRGDGPVVGSMRVPPPDLTRIRRPGQAFPRDELKSKIDGRDLAAAHGTRDMPVWGSVFKGERGESYADLDLNALVSYLATVQINR